MHVSERFLGVICRLADMLHPTTMHINSHVTVEYVVVLQVGMGSMDCYERDFEEVLLSDTGGYYKRKAAEWINEDSCPEYMLKVCCCKKDCLLLCFQLNPLVAFSVGHSGVEGLE